MCAASSCCHQLSQKSSEPGRAGDDEHELQEAYGGSGHSCSDCYAAVWDIFLSSLQMTK